MLPCTPRDISEPIKTLCRELAPDQRPRFVEVTPGQGAGVMDCFPTVERQVAAEGGSVSYGWVIWEFPGIMLEAEFHAMWKDADGKLHDLTPKPHVCSGVLFLPDPIRIYEGKQVQNRLYPISRAREVTEFIKAAEDEFELMNRNERAHKHGVIELSDSEAEEYGRIQVRKVEALAQVTSSLPKQGRNDPCSCGSGKKFKKCCGSAT